MNEAMVREQQLIELLAAQAHASWSHWMNYLFSVSERRPDGSVLIPAGRVERWDRQRQTEYALLSEQEKQSDRDQAALYLPLVKQSVNGDPDQAAPAKVKCELCGALYEPENGYYEAGEYSYCGNCCHW